MRRCVTPLAAVVATVLAMASTASAHHSGAMFDSAKTMTLKGTVRQFQWVNPHCFIQLAVRDAKGKEQEWSLEMSAPVHLMRLGWKRSSLQPGEQVTITIHPLRNGASGGNVVSVTDASGRPVGDIQ